MARTTPRPTPTTTQTMLPLVRHCPCCGATMWAAYHNYRTLTTLEAVVRLTLQIRRCLNARCPQFRKPYRPEALVGFQGRGCTDGVQPNRCPPCLLEGLLFQWS